MTTNEEIIRQQIIGKVSPYPYFPPTSQIFDVRTDVNSQPYHRFFRGRSDSDRPIFWEREAGYARIQSQTTTPPVAATIQDNQGMCFQIPCSTVLPCRTTPKTTCALPNTNDCVYTSP